ncbi:hypothetical protein GCM10007276_16370 [Agaricicola taiwanensis]|uniref:Polysaccharide biosynthesis protein n=1 Tax=Agaricicola taiwanensis TaxID=591372 RepID=A0A8J2YDF4_9RHOB|nr:hypothetical protein [Agaricicola taiwanensis]GGE39764.1 hypothetical protein GCM10007276_16370 [Agaricicola taiwanensis]
MALLRTSTIALSGRMLQLSLGTAIALLLPLLISPAELGTYFLSQVAIAAGAVLAQSGLTLALPALIGEAIARNDSGKARSLCRTAMLQCLLASAAVCLIGLLLVRTWPAGALASLGIDGLVPVAILAIIPFAALCAVLTEMHRAYRDITLASLLPNAQSGGVAAITLLAFLLALRPSVTQLLFAGLAGLVVAVMIGVGALLRRAELRTPVSRHPVGIAHLALSTWPAFVTSVGGLVISLADQTIAGIIGGAVDAGHYGLGLRLSALLTLPLAIVNAAIMPQIVSLWAKGRRRRLQWLLVSSATTASLCAVLGFGGLAIFAVIGPQPVWDASYEPALLVGVILGFGQLVHTLGGSSGYLLLLLGHQKTFMCLSLTIGGLAIVLASMAMAEWGIVGLAAVMAGANIIQTLACCVMANRLLGLKSHASPISPLRVFRQAAE